MVECRMNICVVQFGCLSKYRSLYDTITKEQQKKSLRKEVQKHPKATETQSVDLTKIVSKNWLNLSIDNHKKYCDLHGYKYYFHELHDMPIDRNVAWYKIKAIKNAMSDSSIDWIFYCDLDTLVMNELTKLEDIIHMGELLGKDLILPEQKAFSSRTIHSKRLRTVPIGANAGQFFIKNCHWSNIWLEKFWNFPHEYIEHSNLLTSKYHDNDALNIMFSSNICQTKFNSVLAPARTFNSYFKPYSRTAKQNKNIAFERNEKFYNDGDFKIHFAGYNFSQRQFLFEQYLSGKSPTGFRSYVELKKLEG